MLKDAFTYTVGENSIGAPKMHTFFGTLSICKFLQYWDSDIELFALRTFATAIVVALLLFLKAIAKSYKNIIGSKSKIGRQL